MSVLYRISSKSYEIGYKSYQVNKNILLKYLIPLQLVMIINKSKNTNFIKSNILEKLFFKLIQVAGLLAIHGDARHSNDMSDIFLTACI